jgi:hypothetical protein
MAPNTALAIRALCVFLCGIPTAMPAARLVAFCGEFGLALQ